MSYIISSPEQLRQLLLSVGFGFILGVVYDIFRIIRLLLTEKRFGIYIQDILYALVCAVTSFIFLLSVTGGRLRFYVLAGCLTGWAVYYFSLGIVAIRAGNAVVRLIKTCMRFLFRIISAPFKVTFNVLSAICRKISRFCGKKLRFFRNFFKIRLQPIRGLIYNRFGVFSNRSKKE